MHMTNYLENQLLDFLFRAGAYTPVGTLYIGLCTGAPTDSTNPSEVTGNAYARAAIVSSLTNWSGTQGATSTAVSSGTSGDISNNIQINFPTPSPAGWGTITHMIICDASSGGNVLFWGPVSPNKLISVGDDVHIAVSALHIVNSGNMSNYLKNKMADFLFRGQTYVPPTTMYHSLGTDTPTSTVLATEPVGDAYARAARVCSLANWAGSQSAGSTAVSSGTGGTTSNNTDITWPTPTGDGWGVVTSSEIWDDPTAGNRLFYGSLGVAKSIAPGALVKLPAGTLTYQIDN